LYGLIRYSGPIEITAPTLHRRAGVIVHRSALSDRDVTHHWGIRTTTAARTLTDLATTLDPAALTRAVNDARVAHVISVDDLPARLRRGQTRQPTRSIFEDTFRTFCTRHRLPQPEINTFIAGYEADRAKDADLVEAGLRVVRVTWDRLTRGGRREAARFRTLLGES
jgi:hypothetical protein